jgi:hypothetical protein
MRYAAMQIITWGTIAGAVCSALMLAILETPSTLEQGDWVSYAAQRLQHAAPEAGLAQPAPATAAVSRSASAAAATP